VAAKRRQKTRKFSGFINAQIDVTYRFENVEAASDEEAKEIVEDMVDESGMGLDGLSVGDWEVIDGPRHLRIELD